MCVKICKENINKLSIAEAVSNNDGKTSGSKLGSFIGLITACTSFLMASYATIIGNPNGVPLATIAAGVMSVCIAGFSYSKKVQLKNQK